MSNDSILSFNFITYDFEGTVRFTVTYKVQNSRTSMILKVIQILSRVE